MSSSIAAVSRSSDDNTWERRYFKALNIAPYALLGASLALSQLEPDQTAADRVTVLGLTALATAWVLFMYTLPPLQWRKRTSAMLVYFVGLLVIGGALEAHSVIFMAFVISGFLQAFVVLPPTLAIVGVAATSCVLYLSAPGSNWLTPAALPFLLFIVALQTITVGGGGYMGIRMSHETEKRRKLVTDLEAALEENAGLHVQLLTQAREAGVLDERQRLAREIHDTLAQGLTGIVTQLEAAEQAHEHSVVWQRHVDQALSLARESLTEARRSVQALRPEPLEGSRLADAISDMAAHWSESASVPVQFEATGRPTPLLVDLEVTLFRVTQEALTNVAKHAKASKVGVTLSYMDDVALLDVRDDGIGFTPGSTTAGSEFTGGQRFGLKGMSQRLQRVGGRLEIESAPGAGTAISASVPAIAAEGGA
ncbi:MAG TPA: sensor histidine kinase [Ktedonobacterales bacterium]